MTRKPDPNEARAREIAIERGIDPDSRAPKPGTDKTWPAKTSSIPSMIK